MIGHARLESISRTISLEWPSLFDWAHKGSVILVYMRDDDDLAMQYKSLCKIGAH